MNRPARSRNERRPWGRTLTACAAGLAACLAAAPGLPPAAAAAAELSGGPPATPRPRLGFFAASRGPESDAERIFLDTPSPQRARDWLKTLTEEPHVAGTPEDKRLAEYVRDRMRDFGLKAELVPYEVLLNYPKSVSLRLLKPEPMELSLREAGLTRDKDSWSDAAFPAFHGYGASGSASGQTVYVNYGRREDFERLEAMGLSVHGRIALVRYGKIFRGLKVKEAQDRGALGVIIYSDPADDGYMTGDVYPDGPARPASAIQRGSVQFLSSGPGDPTTPGRASTHGAKRVPYEQVEGIPRIPSLPLSYGEAEKILRAMGGGRVPDDWQGGLPFAYHVGPGGAEVAMDVAMDYAVRPIYDVIATIPGTIEADRVVVLGNHRDAWTYGAVDPNSGTASLLEAARGLGAALKAGWKPHRTLLLASWDGEEYGLLGSTEWVEDRMAWLQANTVAYVNLDISVSGHDLDVDGIPSLRDLVLETTGDLAEPRRGGTLLDAWRSRKRSEWARNEPITSCSADDRFELHLNPLGSGSDYTAFTHHAGIASLSFSFEGTYGVYHSIYDDFFWMDHFGDPGFEYHALAARLFGLLAMRLANADMVPLRYGPYAEALARELELLRRDTLRTYRVWEAAGGDAGRDVDAAAETRKRPALRPDLAPIDEAIRRFAAAATALDGQLQRLQEAGADKAAGVAQLNDALVRVERAFLDPQGLPGRAWFRHALFAPGLTTGYASWPFPAVVQGLQDRDAAAVDAAIRSVTGRIAAGTAALQDAQAVAERMGAAAGR
jgi:N-acetylated-alpha-linked acidic dipeptidase